MWENNYKFVFILFFSLAIGSSPLVAQAGGAFSTTPKGDPVLWENGEVYFRMDPGGPEDAELSSGTGGEASGCMMIPEAQATEIKGFDMGGMVRNAFKQWSDQAPGLNITEGPPLEENVTFANAENYYVGTFVVEPFTSTVTADPCYKDFNDPACKNAIIFDPHGLVTDGILGRCARYGVFGFASILPLRADDEVGTITSPILKAAQLVINGTCVTPVDPGDDSCAASQFGFTQCPIEMDQKGAQGVITHEVGHFLGLDHVLVEKDLYLKCSDPEANCSDQELEKIPTMIGLAVPGADLHTLTQDDKSAIRGFYPSNGNCSIKGIVQTDFGDKNGRCFEVLAKKQGDSDYVVAGMSGAYVDRHTQGESCGNANDDGSMDATTYSQCVSESQGSNHLKVHTNCTKAAENCGEFEIFGVENGTYDLTIQTFRDTQAGGDTIPFIIEPCDQPRNETTLFNADKKENVASVAVNCPGSNDAGIIVID